MVRQLKEQPELNPTVAAAPNFSRITRPSSAKFAGNALPSSAGGSDPLLSWKELLRIAVNSVLCSYRGIYGLMPEITKGTDVTLNLMSKGGWLDIMLKKQHLEFFTTGSKSRILCVYTEFYSS